MNGNWRLAAVSLVWGLLLWSAASTTAQAPTGDPFQLSSSAGPHEDSHVVVDGDGNFTVVWRSRGGQPIERLRGRRFRADGSR